MKKKLFVLFGIVFGAFLFAFTFAARTYAEEVPQEQEPTTEVVESTEATTEEVQEVALSEEDKSKIDTLVDTLQSLSKDDLVKLLNEAKGWFIALGITGVTSLMAAIIGLIAAITKLRNEKIKNSNLNEEAKQKQIDANNAMAKTFTDKTNEIKELMLTMMNGLEDKDKKQVESNIAEVKAKMLEYTTKNE